MSRRARVRTRSAHAAIVAAALAPDNTPEMETSVEGDAVETTIERGTTGGLRTTLDDYVIGLSVAERVVRTAERHATDDTDGGATIDGASSDRPRTGDDSDNDTNP